MGSVIVRVLGWVLLAAGVIGFVIPFPGLMDLTPAHDVIHLVTGTLAVIVAGNAGQRLLFARVFGIVYLLVAAVGLVTRDVFGLITLDPADTLLHVVLAAALLYVGFVAADAAKARRAA